MKMTARLFIIVTALSLSSPLLAKTKKANKTSTGGAPAVETPAPTASEPAETTPPVETAPAQEASKTTSPEGGAFGPFVGHEDGFALSAGLNWGYGSAQSATGSTEARAINTLEVGAAPGYRMGDWAPRLLLSYGITGQNTDPSSVKGTNVRGSGYLIGLGTTYAVSAWQILAGIDFYGVYTQGEKTSDGTTSEFRLPFGVRLGGSYHLTQNFSADANFHFVQYSENKTGDTVTSISNNRMRFWTLGVGLSYQM